MPRVSSRSRASVDGILSYEHLDATFIVLHSVYTREDPVRMSWEDAVNREKRIE